MSESSQWTYRVNAQRQRELYLARIRENTQRFHDRFVSMYDDLIRQDFLNYIPEELSQVKLRLEEIEQSLHGDPEQAQRASMELGSFISGLPGLARAVRAKMQQREMQRAAQLIEAQQRESAELQAFLDELWTQFSDPVVRDFALDELQAVRQEALGKSSIAQGAAELKKTVMKRVSRIREDAERRAIEWKAEKAKELKSKTDAHLIEIHREQFVQDAKEAPAALNAVLADLDVLRERHRQGLGHDSEVEQALSALLQRADQTVIDERYRRESVAAIVKSALDAGFTLLDDPRRIREGARDEVVILVARPAGNKAKFRVALNGDCLWNLDDFEGNTCKKEIADLQTKMKEIYGVEFSDRRVIRENPDRIYARSKPVQSGKKGTKHGR